MMSLSLFILIATQSTNAASVEYFSVTPLVSLTEQTLRMSGDGSTVFLRSETGYVRLRRGLAPETLQTLEPLCATPQTLGGVSMDGEIFEGVCITHGGAPRAFRWTPTSVTLLDPRILELSALSDDGNVNVGSALSPSGTPQAFRMQAGSLLEFFSLTGDASVATALTPNGTWSAGSIDGVRLFRSGPGSTELLECEGRVTALSEDGATLFGIGSESMQGGQAFRWTQSGGFEDLARLPGATFTHVAAVASEGTAVGTQYSPGFSPSRTHAVLWTPSGEALSLQTLLAASGVNVEDVYLMFAFDLSNDAGAVTGVSFSPSLGMRVFIADLRSPCIADFNQDGGVDGSDVTAFFEAWESGSIQADANADGGIDGADVSAFFALWENGGCS